MTNIVNWADSRSTSIQIAEAIFDIANDNDHADRIWESPTPAEQVAVTMIAFDLADRDATMRGYDADDVLHWDDETIKRPAYA